MLSEKCDFDPLRSFTSCQKEQLSGSVRGKVRQQTHSDFKAETIAPNFDPYRASWIIVKGKAERRVRTNAKNGVLLKF